MNRALLAASGIVLLLSMTSAVGAQEPTSSEVALARAQFQQGVAAAQAGNWEEALKAFTRANKLFSQPIILLNLASAQSQTGHFVAAAENYRRLLRSPSVAEEQRAAARDALESLEPRIAHVKILVRDGKPGDRVALDENPVSSAALGQDLPIDPGAHALVLTRLGASATREAFSIGPSESRVVTLTYPQTTLQQRSEKGKGLFASPWFWTAVGVAAAGATVGIVCAAGSCGSNGHPTAGNVQGVQLP